jgi:hypothetical protein
MKHFWTLFVNGFKKSLWQCGMQDGTSAAFDILTCNNATECSNRAGTLRTAQITQRYVRRHVCSTTDTIQDFRTTVSLITYNYTCSWGVLQLTQSNGDPRRSTMTQAHSISNSQELKFRNGPERIILRDQNPRALQPATNECRVQASALQ